MQEDIDRKSIVFITNSSKVTAKTLLKLIKMYIAHLKKPTIHQGKQTMQQLAKQGQGMTNIEITAENIKIFEKYAKKYGVDFALKLDKTETPLKHLVFFKAKDNDAILAAFKEFSVDIMKKAERPSVIKNLRNIKAQVENEAIDKVKIKNKEQSR